MKAHNFIITTAVTGALAVTANLWHLQAAPAAIDAGDQRVAAELNSSLRRYITSPSGKLNLVVKPTERSNVGYFSEIVISGKPVRVKKLQISELNLRARNVRIDVPYMRTEGKVRTLTSSTSLRAVVTENDLTTLLGRGKHTKEMGLRVKYLGGDRMRVTGRLNYTLVNGPIVGTGRLRLMPGSKVHLVIDSLQLRGHEVPSFVKDQLSSRINPVIDYQDLPFQPRFKGLTVKGSSAILSA
jgi:hypothetical protein